MLSNLPIDFIYSTENTNLAERFYVPTLSEAIHYKRVSGYFSAASLSLFATGIEQLAKNGGTYQLLISDEISLEDYDEIKNGYANREKFRQKCNQSLSDYEDLDSEQKKNFANLAFLIERGIVDIKFGFTVKGLFHSKFGIISDSSNNKIYFSGSLNETESAFIRNYETISVLSSWKSQDMALVIDKEEKGFNDLWNGKNKNPLIFVKDFNEVVKFSLMKYSKGKFIMDASLLNKNSLILYYENNQLGIENTLNHHEINKKNRSIKKLTSKYLIDDQLWKFREDISYMDMKNIISLLEKYAQREDINFIVSKSVTEYISTQEFSILDISKRGLLIKNQDNSTQESFYSFTNVLSKELDRQLRPIQAWVSFYMMTMRRVGNFSVPGSGKTAMMFGTFAYLSSDQVDTIDKIVMIGPKNSFKSWKDEFKEVFGSKRELKVLDTHSKNFRPEMLSKNVNDYNLMLFNYESLFKYKNLLKKIIDSRTMLIFDEVHKIKNIDSTRAALAIDLAQNTKYRYVLTGTPIPNTYRDVWNFLHILFSHEYYTYFNFSKSELDSMSDDMLTNFNEKLFPFYWRITKKELDVPPANSDEFYISTATQLEQDVIDLLWRKYGHSPFLLYIRLIQMSSNPSLLKKNIKNELFVDIDSENEYPFEYMDQMEDTPNYSQDELMTIERLHTSSKFENALSKVDNLIQQDKTVIVWCIFIDTMNKFVHRLEEKGHRVALINGKVDAVTREEIITKFQKGEYDVLVTNPHTLAESVSLHKICHDAVYLEYSFNLTHMLQSRDRIHRLGLNKDDSTNYYYFQLQGQDGKRSTIDKKIYNRLKEKEEKMIESIEGTQIGVSYSIDERNEILSLMEEELSKKP